MNYSKHVIETIPMPVKDGKEDNIKDIETHVSAYAPSLTRFKARQAPEYWGEFLIVKI